MNEKIKELLSLVNNMEVASDDAFEVARIKDLICYLSEEKIQGKVDDGAKEYLDTVLNQAAIKIRTFGYTSMQQAQISEKSLFGDELQLLRLRNTTIREVYRSRAHSRSANYFLDIRQKQVLDTFNESLPRRLFVSAPTSFGKTFLLKEIINSNYDEYQNIVIVLPTVALLHEVTSDLTEFFKSRNFNYQVYNSIFRDMEVVDKAVYVLTPERAVRLFALFPNIKINFFFYDEIYKIDEDAAISNEDDQLGADFDMGGDKNIPSIDENNRAVAFRIALYLLLKKSRDFYIAGPYIEVDKLKQGFIEFISKYKVKTLEFRFEPTLKNKIDFSSTAGKLIKRSPISGVEEIETGLKGKDKKIKYLKEEYLRIDENHQTIFFCLHPTYTNTYAEKYGALISREKIGSERYSSFIEHLEKNFNFSYGNYGRRSKEDWTLLKALKKGVGIHNGKLPKYFQKEIMQLFNDKELPVLFCTSTIIEGVNSNAKNIVLIHTPQGKSDAGKRFTLLNINGRAGRYLRHFVGNVVYLDEKQQQVENSLSISLDYKILNDNVQLSDHDLENIEEVDLGTRNQERKKNLEQSFDKAILPDEVFIQNRLIERKIQERVLKLIISRIGEFKGIDNATVEGFTASNTEYLNTILSIWFDYMKPSQINAMKWFAKNYAEKSYAGVLSYAFSRFIKSEQTKNIPKDEKKLPEFINKVYRQVFTNVKDTIEFQFPRIPSLFEVLIDHAFKLKGRPFEKPLDLSPIIRFYEIGVKSELGLLMSDKGVPIVTIKKVEDAYKDALELSRAIDGKDESFCDWYKRARSMFDSYEQLILDEFVKELI
ncbi:MAG: hypothetical protein FWE03_00030 [Firmicutes bacterium]|nr:hypothetical protein [Bacillota bacterium]